MVYPEYMETSKQNTFNIRWLQHYLDHLTNFYPYNLVT